MIVSEAKKIGMQIQIARKKRQLSQADLAQMVDLTPKYLSMIECGTQRHLNLKPSSASQMRWKLTPIRCLQEY